MKIAMAFSYNAGFKQAAAQFRDLERAGLDQITVAEAYSFDAVSQVGYLAAVTDRVEIVAGILNVFSRTPALVAMTAAGCDYVSDGRFVLGLGASGPQVVEGFHGVPYEKPMARTREYIDACRMIWKRQPFAYSGRVVHAPLQPGLGTGLGKPLKLINHPIRPSIPIWWAALGGRSVEAAAEVADGWLPTLFVPDKFERVWGSSLSAGRAKRDPALGPLDIIAGARVAIGEDIVGDRQRQLLDAARQHAALYIGGMGASGANFYNDICRAYGYEREASLIQDLYLSGRKAEAAAAVPEEFLLLSNLVGTPGFVKERLEVYRKAGVTVLAVTPIEGDSTRTIECLRALVDDTASAA
jgi:F420-dependent oxidoreductase-like protein